MPTVEIKRIYKLIDGRNFVHEFFTEDQLQEKEAFCLNWNTNYPYPDSQRHIEEVNFMDFLMEIANNSIISYSRGGFLWKSKSHDQDNNE